MRIGILGGTFNPIHFGHIKPVLEVKDKIRLDRIYFVPSYIPPHKELEGGVSAAHRCRMVELAVDLLSGLYIDKVEIERGSTSYTIETLKYFHKQFPNDERFFLIGHDSFGEIGIWKQYQKLFDYCQFVVFNRGQADPSQALAKLPDSIKIKAKENVKFLNVNPADFSSTDIRERIRAGRSIEGLVPDVVRDYILRHHLYE